MNIAGYMRIGIFCTRDILPGEFLSYDYRFDTKDGSKFVCLCGSANCRGTMKGGAKKGENDATVKKSKKQLLSEAKQRYEKDLKFIEEYEQETKERLNMTDMHLPGSHKESSDLVINGPKKTDIYDARRDRVFLWRNVVVSWSLVKRRYVRWIKHFVKREAFTSMPSVIFPQLMLYLPLIRAPVSE